MKTSLINKFVRGLLSFAFLLTVLPVAAQTQYFNNYITRNVSTLYDGTTPYRFISYDAGWFIDTSLDAEPSEQEDFFLSMAQAGGTVVRFMEVSMAQEVSAPDAIITGYANGQVTYNEANFRRLDKAIQLAGENGVRIILPLCGREGGTWAGYVGLGATDFYGDNPTALAPYEQFLSTILNRTNFYTGVQYKNDKTILCWETGNEIDPEGYYTSTLPTWTSTIGAYIKSIDSNHLVMDGRAGLFTDALTDPNIDIIDRHYYWFNPTSTFESDWAEVNGYKAFIMGEFGFVSTSVIHDLMQAVISSGASGALLWELQAHSDSGEFVEWSDDQSNTADYQGYRWPGFPSGSGFDETNVFLEMRADSYQIRGISPLPTLPIPNAPTNLRIFEVGVPELSWRGSTGAASYNIERATSASGPWTTIATNVSDAVVPSKSKWQENSYPVVNDGPPIYSDTTATIGTTYYYQITATNSVGTSGASNIVTTTVSRLAIVDEFADYTKIFAQSSNIGLATGYWLYRRDYRDRLTSTNGSPAWYTYQAPQNITSFMVEALPGLSPTSADPNLTFFTSPDNVTYTPITCNETIYNDTPVYLQVGSTAPYIIFRASSQIPAGTRYVKIQINDSSTEVLRDEVEYGTATNPAVNAEVEDLRVVSCGSMDEDLNTATNNPAASSGAYSSYAATGVGDYVVYRVFVPNAGTYNVNTVFQKGPNCGCTGLSISNSPTEMFTNLGNQSIDLYSATTQFVNVANGTYTFPIAGDYYFQYTVTNKDANSTGYTMAFDVIQLTGYQPAPPENLSGLMDLDIGSPGMAGSGAFDGTTYTVAGGGADISGGSDQFNYFSETVTGTNQTIIAEVTSLTNTNAWAKTGIMFRNSTAANDMFVDLVATEANGVNLQWRSSVGSQSANGYKVSVGAPTPTNPIWLELVRSGTTYTGYYSTNGTTWNLIGSPSVTFTNSSYLAGLAVTAHNNGALNTSTVTNLSIMSLADADIGSPGEAGSATYDGQTYTVAGGGADIWHTSDQFTYDSQTVTGDQTITAEVTSITNTNSSAKAGLMFRDSSAAGAIFVDLVATESNGINLQYRTSTGGYATQLTPVTSVPAPTPTNPVWLALVKTGTNYYGYYSTDGTTWNSVGSVTVTFTNSSYLEGLAVTAHNNSALNTATFINVEASPPSPPLSLADADIGSPGDAGSAAYNGTTYTVAGGGADIWGTSDQFNYDSRTAMGSNQTIIAEVTSITNTSSSAKAGLMFRDSSAANAIFVDLVATESNGINLQYRTSTGGSAAQISPVSVPAPTPTNPVWLELVRSGTTYTGYYSTNGTNWSLIGNTTVTLTNLSYLEGLAVTAHNNSALNTATFINVDFGPPVLP